MGTPSSNGPSIITHHTERSIEEKGKEGKRNSYLAEEEDIRIDNDGEEGEENCRNLLVTFDDGTTTETQETDSIDF